LQRARALYDIIFDAVGKIAKSKSEKAPTPNGTYVSVPHKLESEKIENLVFLKELTEAEKLQSVIDQIYQWEQIVEAYRYVDKQ
jgi:hypothetical protein